MTRRLAIVACLLLFGLGGSRGARLQPCGALQAAAAIVLQNLQVEYRTTPLGIDVAQPRFGWQMQAPAGERGVVQSAYRIEVREANGSLAWDSTRSDGAESLGIRYAGVPLKPATRYTWTVTAWTASGVKAAATSWFETGLMDPSPRAAAWIGAKWIGGGDEDLVLYSPYLAIFDARFSVAIAQRSTRASFVYGANDSRLMDRDKNVYQLQNRRDQSYIKLELDISAVDGTLAGIAKLHVYRAGYAPTDTAARPLRSFDKAVKEGGREARRATGVTFLKYERGKAVFRLESGAYEFTATR